MQLVCVCLANVFFIVVSSNIASLIVPRSIVALIGDRVEMKCSVTGSDLTTWTYTALNTSTVTNIYLGEDMVTSMRSRYKIDKNISEQHNLIIDSVDFTYAGRYRCSAAIQKTLWNDIQLTVLDSDPVCAANTTESHVDGNKQTHLTIWCSISYTGNGIPVFSWTKSNADKNIAANETTSGRGPVNKTSLIVQQLHASDNGVTFHCQITFQCPNSPQRNATNIYENMWNYTPYGPRNIRIVEYEDRLECSADGNPTPIYRWTDVETNISTNGSVYLLYRAKDNEHTFECTATNTFASERKNYTIKDSVGTQGDSDFPIRPTALASGGSLLFLMIIGLTIIASCIVHRKRLKDDTSARPDGALNADLNSYGRTSMQPTSAGNQTPQKTDTSYCTLNIQPEESRIYCEIRSCEQSSANYVNQACEEQLLKGKRSQRNNDSRGTASAVLKPLSHQPNRLLSDPSVKLTSTTLSTKGHNDPHVTATNADYCAFTDRLKVAQEPQYYCELRLNDQSGSDYINQ